MQSEGGRIVAIESPQDQVDEFAAPGKKYTTHRVQRYEEDHRRIMAALEVN